MNLRHIFILPALLAAMACSDDSPVTPDTPDTPEGPDITNSVEKLVSIDAGQQGTDEANGETTYNTLVSFLGRVMYNYDNRYYISASLRADAVSYTHLGKEAYSVEFI